MSGDRTFHLPGGDLATIRHTARDTDGALFEFEAVLAPGRSGPPAHLHVGQEESFTVVEGLLRVRSGWNWSEFGAGETVTVPSGTVHTFANRSDKPVRMVVRMTPALAFEQMLRIQGESRVPPILRIASLNHGPDTSFFLSGLPLPVQRRMWNALARIARLTGRTEIPANR
ncbi:cupin domain-containing protein [Actinomadura sp. HBU206391]|uniref:cupin domain-containing protein n=1 Tax=Actinomadura sp. HBU206391 TaxID=2731692 RepID=UPI001650730C|nr:cupin domain-containing protein [Actinomadura sp. HBU206391]MBC6463230.1 cupin domain-containing protein [Actinomadura sp. HBU206391]